MTKTSWVEICVSDFEQSIQWFENVLGFRVVARDANKYAELTRGETSIQLAADDAPYWEPERSRLLPPGQRGSGVEIDLLVENVDAVYHQAQQARADIVRPLADYPWHMRQFWVRHPDGYLIRPAQRILSVNPATYRRQVAEAFQEDKPRITQELLTVKKTADSLAQQQDYLGAATIYETLIMEIFAQSHLYVDEEAEEEGGLEELVTECIEALGDCLANEQADRVAREKLIQVLFAIYQHDLHADNSIGFATSASDLLVTHTMPLEGHTIAEWIHDTLANEEEEITGSERKAYGGFLLELEQDTLDDEAYLQICRETGRVRDLVDRLLTLGRIDEAVTDTERVGDDTLLSLTDLFIQHRQDLVAERLVRERIQKTPNTRLMEWLKKYYQARNNHAAALELAETIFRTRPYLADYKEIRHLATQLSRWETMRPTLLAFLEQAQNTTLLIQIALDEGEIDKALDLVKAEEKRYPVYGGTPHYNYNYFNLSLS